MDRLCCTRRGKWSENCIYDINWHVLTEYGLGHRLTQSLVKAREVKSPGTVNCTMLLRYRGG